MQPTTRLTLEMLYGVLLPALPVLRANTSLYRSARSLVVMLAAELGKECPQPTHEEQRQARRRLIEQEKKV